MEINPKFLFNLLIRYLKPDLVCDIGSMDGADALRFAKILPDSQVILFEANPDNFLNISQNPFIKESNILSFNDIIWNKDGVKEFHIVKPSSVKGVDEHLRGMSSAFSREEIKDQKSVQLRGVRLDSKVAALEEFQSIALWIDVEGATYEALEGITGIRDKVKLIHAEVETKAFWDGQKIEPDVIALAEQMGYVLLGHGRNQEQHDIVLIDGELIQSAPMTFRFFSYVAHLKALNIKRFFNRRND